MDEYGRRPWSVNAAAYGLWARAALRVPLPVLVLFYLVNGIDADGRAPDYPDGAFFMTVSYAAGDLDNLLWYPLSRLAGPWWKVLWLIGFAVGTVGYVLAGVLVRRGLPPTRRAHRAAIGALALHAVYQAAIFMILVPVAIDAVDTGENAIPLPRTTPPVFGDTYAGQHLIQAYEWLLLPWALALAAVAVSVLLLIRSTRVRALTGPGVDGSGR